MRPHSPIRYRNGKTYAFIKMTEKEIKQLGVPVVSGYPPYRLGIPQRKSDQVLSYPRATGATEHSDLPPRD